MQNLQLHDRESVFEGCESQDHLMCTSMASMSSISELLIISCGSRRSPSKKRVICLESGILLLRRTACAISLNVDSYVQIFSKSRGVLSTLE